MENIFTYYREKDPLVQSKKDQILWDPSAKTFRSWKLWKETTIKNNEIRASDKKLLSIILAQEFTQKLVYDSKKMEVKNNNTIILLLYYLKFKKESL